ncbi:MAG: tRNA pseudouridine(38-40) synthase TruA [Planctomycetaceae bacterium]|nr:tRNA pseudouridine(38-40) synthase TruA [Planctomycetaceae bacterium]MCA9080457.1 tRNA pseudouridine(38-40) synthase TruA [Planctomycetaceae bacterium]
MRNIRLLLAYDGSAYAGWQIQPDQPTVQGTIEAAIKRLSGETVNVLSAGRTDAGVHALGQVANFRTGSPIPPEKWRAALGDQLPTDIAILESDEVPWDFHATFWAKSKRYRYVIANQVVDDPFLRRYAWRISQPLDVAAMHVAAQRLIGMHDFRCFESHWPNKATSVRTVSHVSVRRHAGWSLWSGAPTGDQPTDTAVDDTSSDPFVSLEIEADGFLYNMVRAITGTLVNVGRGTWTADDVERILQAQDRSLAGGTAPACGLYMAYVRYAAGDARTHD